MRGFWCVGVVLALAGPAAAQDIPLSQVLVPGEGWHAVGAEFKAVRGLAADREGNVYVADPEASHLTRLGADGEARPFGEGLVGAHGLAWGPDNRLYVCQPGRRHIVAVTADGKESLAAKDLPAADVVLTRTGALYCTVPDERAVYLVSADGKERRVAETGFTPAGLVLWPDEGTLVVGEATGRHLWVYRIARDGGLAAGERYYSVRDRLDRSPSACTALTIDGARRAYAATGVGVQVFDPTGRLSGVLLEPEPTAPAPTALTFGGPKHETLYAAFGGKVYARKTQAKGVLFAEKEKC
jgi:sugar lactone lactonase YvrE